MRTKFKKEKNMQEVHNIETNIRHHELDLLKKLREKRHTREKPTETKLSLGARVSDSVAGTVGSWKFIIIQSILLAFWIILNVTAFVQKWDPYPFILLNLVLSFQAAYTAPIIMMSQNRQSEIDRKAAENDYDVNMKAELEIELLHQKIDLLKEKEISQLISVINELQTRIKELKPEANKI